MFKIIATTAAIAALTTVGLTTLPTTQTVTQPQTTKATAVGVSEHDNTVMLSAVNPISDNNVSFQWDGGYNITGGQPWGGVTVNQNSGPIVINVQAGRSGSTGPADWFNAATSMPIGNDVTLGGHPSELNFALSGTLTINGTNYPIVLGQGHTSEGQNNWWLGGQGSGWSEYTVAPEGIKTPDGQYVISGADDDSDNTFEIQTAN